MLSVIVKAKERTDSRASMVRGAVSLIRTRGMNATSLSDVLAESGILAIPQEDPTAA